MGLTSSPRATPSFGTLLASTTCVCGSGVGGRGAGRHAWAGLEEILRLSLCFVATGGETEEEMIRVDILENQVMDVRFAMIRICYSPDFVSPLTWGNGV